MMRLVTPKARVLLVDGAIVLISSSLVCTMLEWIAPGLISFFIDLSLLWTITSIYSISLFLFDAVPLVLEPVQRWYLGASLGLTLILYYVRLSLQVGAHLLALGVVVILVLLLTYHIYTYYDSRR